MISNAPTTRPLDAERDRTHREVMAADLDEQRLGEVWREALQRGLPAHGVLLLVSIEQQSLQVVDSGALMTAYRVSTSKRGSGNTVESYQTPTGWHEVVERYGAGEPAGRVFFERVPTPEVLAERYWREDDHRDLIMTRILRLAGLEDGVNRGGRVDTYERYVYLHGSNHEHRLGTPASHGCIHVGNKEIIDLFAHTEGRPTWCLLR